MLTKTKNQIEQKDTKKDVITADNSNLLHTMTAATIMSLTGVKQTENILKLGQNRLNTPWYSTEPGEFCAILDTGFNGSAVCIKKW